MNIEQILSSITDIANRAYAGAEPADRLAFEVGMLACKLREMSQLLVTANNLITELELELNHRDQK
jgi:hypothetical protein